MWRAVLGGIFVGCCFATSVKVQGDDVLARLRFGPGTLAAPLEIDKVEADGTVTATRLAGPEPKAPLVEGHYLAFLIDLPLHAPDALLPGKTMFVAEVTEILSEDLITLRVGQQAAAKIRSNQGLLLARTLEVTTKELKSLPEVLVLQGPPAGGIIDVEAQQDRSIANLKQIGLAMHNFASVAGGRFPPATVFGPDGKPWHSWRALLLPFLDEQKLADAYKFDEPWDGPNNKKLFDQMPAKFADPTQGDAGRQYTCYAAVTGPGALFPTEGARFDGRKLDFAQLKGTRFSAISDGLSNTIAVVPIAAKAKIPWLKPADIVLDNQGRTTIEGPQIAFPFKSGQTAFAPMLVSDGSVQVFPQSLDAAAWQALFSMDGGEVIDRAKLFAGRQPPRGASGPKITIIRTDGQVHAYLSP